MTSTERLINAKIDEADRLETALRNAGRVCPTRPTLPSHDPLVALDQICAHVAVLKVRVSLAHPKISVPSSVGILSTRSSAGGFYKSEAAPETSSTDRVLKALGVSSLADLEPKNK
jgi:hypothetical protein